MNGSLVILRNQGLAMRPRSSLAAAAAAAALRRNGRANYSSESKRARELVKFPWIWPSEASKTPQRAQYLPRLELPSFLHRFFQWGLYLGAYGRTGMVFSDKYMETVKDKMVKVVLQRIVDAINTCDYDALSQLMVPPVAKVYKLALANMKAQGYTLRISLKDVESSAIETLVLYLGKPESFDTSIPVATRFQKYDYWLNDSIVLSDQTKSLSSGSVMAGLPHPSLLFGALEDDGWKSVQYRFNVRADVEVLLEARGKLVDIDRGTMDIPLALSTPSYEGFKQMKCAVQRGESASHLEPFRWYVSDLFNIAESTEHAHIRKLLKRAK
ncbi:hypothetical protein GGI00_003163 [Coemansia sp. RSA 2681]|nr:hypothetical protein GGI00_003163 [Coemansia sp. RSA 2681]